MAALADKTVLVTGATSGTGLEASVAMARMGPRLVMVGRDPSKTAQNVDEVRSRSGARAVDSSFVTSPRRRRSADGSQRTRLVRL